MAKPTEERRKQLRVGGTPDLTVSLKSSATAVQVRDISLSGISFRTNGPLEVMTQLMMTLVFPAKSIPTGQATSKSIQCEGAVVRCDPLNKGNGNWYETAVFFTLLDDTAKKAIEEYVQNRR